MISAPHSRAEALAARTTGRRSRWAASIGSAARRSRIAKAPRQSAAAAHKPPRTRAGNESHWISAAIAAPMPASAAPC